MQKTILTAAVAILMNIPVMAQHEEPITFRVIETSDIHGSFFPYDEVNRRPQAGTMARISSYIKDLRKTYGKDLILLDNGDILQGQPVNYFTNFVDTTAENIAASVVNYMGYDAETIGNHDIETGHNVYDKWAKELSCPLLGANVVNTATSKPYFKPYVILERQGVKIAVLGMITPAIPNWLAKNLWSGMRFDNMVTAARYWMKEIREKENPDIVIGLFHSGRSADTGGIHTPEYDEDASLTVAQQVPGFDLVLFGHDHKPYSGTVTDNDGHTVVCLDPANNGIRVADAEITFTRIGQADKKGNQKQHISVHGKVVDITKEPIDSDYCRHFEGATEKVKAFVNRRIGYLTKPLFTRDCFFGPSAFGDLIQQTQLKLTGADLSFNAPVLFNTVINAGNLHVSDMFNFYKYENQVYVLKMTGEEIRKHLEMSYDQWVNTMHSSKDHLLLLNEGSKDDSQRLGFKNFSFNFDSAYGIDYTVDVTKPNGSKVTILRMSNGQPFDPNKTYRVAMNSYRGNGGGELLTKGAGIPKDQLENRIVWRSKRDLRFYLMQEIERMGTITPKAGNNWKFIPEKWAKKAGERDKQLLFPVKRVK